MIILGIVADDLSTQHELFPRPLPQYDAGNPEGRYAWRLLQNYGTPHYGGPGSGIYPPISPEEFRSHFGLGSDKIPEVQDSLQFPVTLGGRPGNTFAVESDAQGIPRFLISPELALLFFFKRLRTRGSVLVQLQGFFGRSKDLLSL